LSRFFFQAEDGIRDSSDVCSSDLAVLRQAPALESDPAAHALNELELYRALIAASGIWPASWMVNAFWTPLRQLNATFAPALGREIGRASCRRGVVVAWGGVDERQV